MATIKKSTRRTATTEEKSTTTGRIVLPKKVQIAQESAKKSRTSKTTVKKPTGKRVLKKDLDADLVLDLGAGDVPKTRKGLKKSDKKAPIVNLKAKYHNSEEPLGRDPNPKDYNWSPLKRKNVWDGREGMYVSRDPMSKFSDYPADYVVDPVTRAIPMVRVKSLDSKSQTGGLGEVYKVDRARFLKKYPDAAKRLKLESLPEVEYYVLLSERQFVVAVSMGVDPKKLKRIDLTLSEKELAEM